MSDMAMVALVGSVLGSVLGIVIADVVVRRLPSDALVRLARPRPKVRERRPLRVLVWILRNLVGFGLILLGVALLFLPGQGVLTILLGLALADFPGRRRLALSLVRRPRVLHGLNRWRQRRGGEPFEEPPERA